MDISTILKYFSPKLISILEKSAIFNDLFPKLNLIASGGVANIKDLEELKEIGCSGAIVGKAIYEGRIKLNDLKKFL